MVTGPQFALVRSAEDWPRSLGFGLASESQLQNLELLVIGCVLGKFDVWQPQHVVVLRDIFASIVLYRVYPSSIVDP